MNQTLQIIVQILTTLVTLVPMVYALIKYVVLATKEKNWNKLLSLLLKLCAEAETQFSEGADKKKWVMSMTKSALASINYEIDDETLSALIDSLIELTTKVNI
jgi:hypothetical protein